MVLHVEEEDVPEVHFDTGVGEVSTRTVYGKSMSMVHATRPAGYRSSPHVHEAEQFNYVLEGEVWMFVEEDTAVLEPGDFHRAPSMAVHWAKVESGLCGLIEAHSPPSVGDAELAGPEKENVVGEQTDDEEPVPDRESGSVWAAESYSEDEAAMKEAFRDGESES